MEGHNKKKGKLFSTVGSCVRIVIICQLIVIAFLFASFIPSRTADLNVGENASILQTKSLPQQISQQQFDELSKVAIHEQIKASLDSLEHESRHLTPAEAAVISRPAEIHSSTRDIDLNSLRKQISAEHHGQFHDNNNAETIDPQKIMTRNEPIPAVLNPHSTLPAPVAVKTESQQQPLSSFSSSLNNLFSSSASTSSQERVSLPLDLSEDHICRKYPKVCQCEPLDPKVCIHDAHDSLFKVTFAMYKLMCV
jgi:hypothetical protein